MTSVSDRDIVFLSPFADDVTDATFTGVYAPVSDVTDGFPSEVLAQTSALLTAVLALDEEHRPFDPAALQNAVYAPATVYENKHVYDASGSVVWFARSATDDMLCINKYGTGIFFDRSQQYIVLFPTGKENQVGLLSFDYGKAADEVNIFSYVPSLSDDDGFLEQDTYEILDVGLSYLSTISSNDVTLDDVPEEDEDEDEDYVAGANENFDEDEEEFEDDDDEDEDDDDDENEAGPSGPAPSMDVAPDEDGFLYDEDEDDSDEEEDEPTTTVSAPPSAKRRKI